MSERVEAVLEVSKWGVGLGVLLVQIFPLALPLLLLTLVVLVVLALPLIALGLMIGLVAIAIRPFLKSKPHRAEEVAIETGNR